MNLGVVLPEPGYLEAVREITRRHGIVLIFDEVKTGLCIAAGRRDRAASASCPTWSRSPRRSAAASPSARSAAARRSWPVVEDGTVYQVGTYNGNPLVHGRGAREPRAGPDARRLRALDALNDRILDGLHRRHREVRPAGLRGRHRLQGLRHVLADEDRRLRDVQGQPGRRARRPRLALQHEPRHLHDARPRGGVDALGDAHRRGGRPLRRRLRGDGARAHDA